MPTSMVVVLDNIAAARPALSGAVVLHARNADRAAGARRALPKAEAVVVGDVGHPALQDRLIVAGSRG